MIYSEILNFKDFLKKYLIIGIILNLSVNIFAADYELIWVDNFDSTALDNSKWRAVNKGDGFGNNEKQYYTDRDENLYFQDGKLVIRAIKEYYEGPKYSRDYTSAKIQTKNKVNFKYKSIRVRAKLPAGTGTWPAIWMLGSNIDEVSWPACGEIDIMEHVGFDPGAIHGTIHCDKYNGMDGTHKGGSIQVSDFASTYHTYRIDWYNNKIDWYVDDNKYFTYHKEEGAPWRSWPFDQEFFLILNLAIGGNWGGIEGIDDSIFPVEMKVDWVKIYDMPIIDIDSDTLNYQMEPGNSASATGKILNIENIGAGELEPLSIEKDVDWLDVNWSSNSGNQQSLEIAPNSSAEKLLPGIYMTNITIQAPNANNMQCRIIMQIGDNLALNKPVKASSFYSHPILSTEDNPEFVNDGDLKTKWRSQSGADEWIMVDLGNYYRINKVRLFWALEITSFNGYGYEFQLSNDSTFSDYEVIASNNYSQGGTEIIDTDTSKIGRYIRLYGDKSGDFADFRLFEMELYGYEAQTNDITSSGNRIKQFKISNYPNPFNSATIINYQIPQSSQIKIDIYNLNGNKIKTLVEKYHEPGKYKIKWKPQVASAVYFYRLISTGNLNNQILTKRMLYLK